MFAMGKGARALRAGLLGAMVAMAGCGQAPPPTDRTEAALTQGDLAGLRSVQSQHIECVGSNCYGLFDRPEHHARDLALFDQDLVAMKQSGFNAVWLHTWWHFFQPDGRSTQYSAAHFATLKQKLAKLRQAGMKAILPLNLVNPTIHPSGIDLRNVLDGGADFAVFAGFVDELMRQLDEYADDVYLLVFPENWEMPLTDDSGVLRTNTYADPTWSRTFARKFRGSFGSLRSRLRYANKHRFRIGYHDDALTTRNAAQGERPVDPAQFDFVSVAFYPDRNGPESSRVMAAAPSSLRLEEGYYGQPLRDELDLRVQNLRGYYPTHPVIIGETGWAECGPGSAEQRLAYVDGTIVRHALDRSLGFNVWAWSAAQPDDAANCAQTPMAIMDRSGAPRPAAQALRQILAPAPLVNLARSSARASLDASSYYDERFPYASVVDGDKAGRNWERGGGWNSKNTPSDLSPEWIEVRYNAPTQIQQVDLFTLQDNYFWPVEPTQDLRFSRFGVTRFHVQGLVNGSWIPLGAPSTGNQVWRRVTFPPTAVSAIRVLIPEALASFARVTELETWGPAPDGVILNVPPPSPPPPPPPPPPPLGPRRNVALTSEGAVASASSTFSASFSPAGVNDGERAGARWASGGGWNSAGQPSPWQPETLTIELGARRLLDEVDLFTVQDVFWIPQEPTEAMTFSNYGVTSFEVQVRDQGSWQTVPGGAISGNQNVWRRLTFPERGGDAVRVLVTGALYGYARVTELEAYGR